VGRGWAGASPVASWRVVAGLLTREAETIADYTEPLRNVVLAIMRRVLPPFVPPSRYLERPLATWPPLVGIVHDIKLPRRTKPHGPTGAANINILVAMIDRTAPIAGDLAECGVFRGASLIPMAVHLRQVAPGKHLFGFDSFAGFDNSILLDIGMGGPPEANKRVGAFGETSPAMVRDKLQHFRAENVTLIPGYFRDSLPQCADQRFSFVHLDIGIYDAYRECLEFFYPRLSSGGIILLNDYGKARWPGCTKAVDEFLSSKSEKLQVIEMGHHRKFYICRDQSAE
jgi:O-methyltransferase